MLFIACRLLAWFKSLTPFALCYQLTHKQSFRLFKLLLRRERDLPSSPQLLLRAYRPPPCSRRVRGAHANLKVCYRFVYGGLFLRRNYANFVSSTPLNGAHHWFPCAAAP